MATTLRTNRGKLILLAAACSAVAGCGVTAAYSKGAKNTMHTSVAPWDMPDGPNPDADSGRGPLLPDPPSLVHANGYEGKLPNGISVRLNAVSRQTVQAYPASAPGSNPVWTPEGAPIPGPVQMLASGPPAELIGQGSRFLLFTVTAPLRASLSVFGLVPECARSGTPKPALHGRAEPIDNIEAFGTQMYPAMFGDPSPEPQTGQYPQIVAGGVQQGLARFTQGVVVDDRSASHYRFALSADPWEVIANVPIDPAAKDDNVIAKGSWGTLRRVAPPKEKPGASFKYVMPRVTYTIDPPDGLPEVAVRFDLLDASGHPNAQLEWITGHGAWSASLPRGMKPSLARTVRIETRHYQWIEFSNVHYDPDPKYWPFAYWGHEGDSTIAASGETKLYALLRPQLRGRDWVARDVYALDGKLWRAFPWPDLVQPQFADAQMPADCFVAAMTLDGRRVSTDRTARISAFEASSEKPGKGLGAPLKQVLGIGSRPQFQFLLERPKKEPYVQIKVEYSKETWRKVAEFRALHPDLPLVPPERKAEFAAGHAFWPVFSVYVRPACQADIGYTTRAETSKLIQGAARWDASACQSRLLARLKSGTRVPLARSSWSMDGSYAVDFELNADSEAVYDQSRHDTSDKTRVELKDVDSFEIETRGYAKPLYLAAKVPAK